MKNTLRFCLTDFVLCVYLILGAGLINAQISFSSILARQFKLAHIIQASEIFLHKGPCQND